MNAFRIVAHILAICTPVFAPQTRAADDGDDATEPPKALVADDIIELTKTPPITFPKTSSTRAEFTKATVEWGQRVLVPAMVVELTAADVAHTRQSCEDMAKNFLRGPDDPAARKRLLDEAIHLVKPDSPMPTMQLLVSDELSRLRNENKQLPRRKAGYDEKALEKTPPIVKYLSAIRLLDYEEKAEIPVAKLIEQAVSAAVLAISPEHCTDADAPVVMSIILIQTPDRIEKRIAPEMIAAMTKADAPEWLRLTLVGNLEIKLAWKIRGAGFANTVSAEGWKGFEEHLVKAREALGKAWKLMPSRPEAASLMIKVAMGGHAKGDTARLWFDRAVAAQCDYPEAYNSLIYSLTPRWGGSNAEMLAFAIACQKTGRYDTEIPGYFIHCINDVAQELPDWRIIFRQAEISKMLLETLAKLAERGITPSFDFGDLGYYSWLAGDMKRASSLFNKHGSWTLSREIASAAIQIGVDTNQAFVEAGPYNLPVAKLYNEAKTAIEDKDWTRAEDLTGKLTAEPANKRIMAIKALPELFRFERDYSLGKWAKLPVGYPEWSRKQGSVNLFERGRIKLTSVQTNASYAVFHGDLGDRFEVRGKVKFPAGKKQSFQLLSGFPSRYAIIRPSLQWFQCSLETTDGKTASVRYGGSTPFLANPERPGPEITQEVSFRFRRDKTKIGFWINDKPVIEGLEIPKLPAGEGSFGVGGRTFGGSLPVEYSELEAQRIGDSA